MNDYCKNVNYVPCEHLTIAKGDIICNKFLKKLSVCGSYGTLRYEKCDNDYKEAKDGYNLFF